MPIAATTGIRTLLGSELELSAELDGQAERHVFLDEPIRLDVVDATGAEPVADPADELLGSGGARGDPDRGCAFEPRFVDLGLVVDQIGGRPAARAVSTRRFEFDELRDPITSRRSISGSISFTAHWRFEVA